MRKPAHKNDFVDLYNLEDPGPYYRGLEPADYRMPNVVAGVMAEWARQVRQQRGSEQPVRFLDVGCGYGALGTIIRYQVTMRELFAYHGQHDQLVRNPTSIVTEDIDFLGKQRRPNADDCEIRGLDIAGKALRYAQDIGAIDGKFVENLIESDPSPELATFLRDTDVIMECGALAILYEPGFQRLIVGAAPNRPPLIFCPRPDADSHPACRMFESLGYTVETLLAPTSYRRCLSDHEMREVRRDAANLGREGTDAIVDGYLQVPIIVAYDRENSTVPLPDLSRFAAQD